MSVCGFDISEYAIKNCHPAIQCFIHQGSIEAIAQLGERYTLSIGRHVLSHMDISEAKRTIRQLDKISRHTYLVLATSSDPEKPGLMKLWDSTYKTTLTPDGWRNVFRQIDYGGNYQFDSIV
jgi:hypothetical protein